MSPGGVRTGALEAVTEFADTIDTIARKIEQAIDADHAPARLELAPLPAA